MLNVTFLAKSLNWFQKIINRWSVQLKKQMQQFKLILKNNTQTTWTRYDEIP